MPRRKRPRLRPHLRYVWAAFHILASRRTMGGGMQAMPNPLQWSEVAAYGAHAGYTGDALERFISLILEMDAEYISWSHDKLSKGTGKGNAGQRPIRKAHR